tara:strand:- start:2169 stop:3026 length:858 start_codon:yes stop_codon:yes gene_type:complete
MIKHNKKRNTLLLYEFLMKSLIKSILENNSKQADIKIDLLKRFHNKDSQLLKEHKIMRALSEMKVSCESTVDKIFEDVKDFSRNIDYKALFKEKTLIINEIHNKVKDDDFYNYHVNEYILYATIHNLISEYRKNIDTDFDTKVKISIFEDNIKQHLKEQKREVNDINIENENIYNNLTTKIIIERFNNKYSHLNSLQNSLLKEYTFNHENINKLLMSAKKQILEHIDTINDSDTEVNSDSDLMNKMNTIKEDLENISIENNEEIDDVIISEIICYGEIMNYDASN